MGEHRSRKEDMELGIPVAEEKWAEVLPHDILSQLGRIFAENHR